MKWQSVLLRFYLNDGSNQSTFHRIWLNQILFHHPWLCCFLFVCTSFMYLKSFSLCDYLFWIKLVLSNNTLIWILSYTVKIRKNYWKKQYVNLNFVEYTFLHICIIEFCFCSRSKWKCTLQNKASYQNESLLIVINDKSGNDW